MNFADYLGSYNLFLDNIAGLKLHINKFKLESHNLPNQKIKLPNKLSGTETLSIKILKNLKTDITNRFNKIEQLNIKCNDNNSINGFSYHNVLAVSYLDGLEHNKFNDNLLVNDDIVSLIIEDTLVDTAVIKSNSDGTVYGIGIVDRYIDDQKPDRIYFGSFKDKIFSLEVGKKIKKINPINKGYGYVNNPKIVLKTISGEKLLSLKSSLNGSGGSLVSNSELKPIFMEVVVEK